MGLAVVASRASVGLEAPEVAVEVYTSGGLPATNIVGLPDTAVRESRDRVRAAIEQCGFSFPQVRITVNLAPADLPKDGGRFDLPIALGILLASGALDGGRLAGCELVGELALDGSLRPVSGALGTSVAAGRAGRTLVVPRSSADEAALAKGTEVLAADHLGKVCGWLRGEGRLQRIPHLRPVREERHPDLADVRGQARACRALEVAAAGGHDILLIGPPGTGKSMLAMRLPGLLPSLAEDEALEVAMIASVGLGRFRPARWGRRPFRTPHHTATAAALTGGGSIPRPGEITLAHRGVLFLDELPEFPRTALEALRQPMEAHRLTVSRARRQVDFPADFQLVAAMNPCPCGYLGDARRACRCTPDAVARYRARVSGPLLDRLDIRVEVARPDTGLLLAPGAGETTTAAVAARVAAARERQRGRGCLNARLDGSELLADGAIEPAARSLLSTAAERFGLSARGCHRVLRVARTLADLAGRGRIGMPELSEALSLRRVEGLAEGGLPAGGVGV